MTEAAVRDSVREAEAYKSPYERWKETEGLPTLRGYHVQDLYPDIHRGFEEALARSGVPCAMGKFHPYCTQR